MHALSTVALFRFTTGLLRGTQSIIRHDHVSLLLVWWPLPDLGFWPGYTSPCGFETVETARAHLGYVDQYLI
jgi:hypothetical protein